MTVLDQRDLDNFGSINLDGIIRVELGESENSKVSLRQSKSMADL